MSYADFSFFEGPFSNDLINESEEEPLVSILDLKTESILSSLCRFSLLQDDFRFRNMWRARKIVTFLFKEEKEWDKESLNFLILELEKKRYVTYETGYNDRLINDHILKILKKLKNETSFAHAIKKFQKPLCHKGAEKLIFRSLGIASEITLTDGHIRQSVLSACLCLLRQNVGSCFATAPAILIQAEQIHLLLEDLYELLTTSRMKRVFSGIEHRIPLSPSTGIGDLGKQVSSLNSYLCYSPGLLEAFTRADLIPIGASIQEKLNIQKELLSPFLKEKISVETLIRLVLLKHFEIDQSFLNDVKKEEKQFAHFQKQLSSKFHGLPFSKQGERAYKLLEIEERVLEIFKAFTDHPLLKSWEYTLASFSEIKMEFSNWNLYLALGLNPNESYGIGELVYRYLNSKLQECNAKIADYHADYEIAFDQVRSTEILFRNISTESEARRLKAEHQSRLYHMRACLDLRDKASAKASGYVEFFDFLIAQFKLHFEQYFQEIYDPQMQENMKTIYDDSPAGFRLVYKHGRSDASLWSLISSEEEWIDALIDFFRSIEGQISASCGWEEGLNEINQLTGLIIHHLRTEEFVKTAFSRVKKGRDSIFSLDDASTSHDSPWAYISGGTLTTLLKTYYKRENELTEESRFVDSESDLLIFILDTLKGISHHIMKDFIHNPHKRMLMYSPTHAFLLQPGFEFLKTGWEDPIFSYTWVRDQVIFPAKNFYDGIFLNFKEQIYLLNRLMITFSEDVAYHAKRAFLTSDQISIDAYREKVVDLMSASIRQKEKGVKKSLEKKVDSFLYESLPLFQRDDLQKRVLEMTSPESKEKIEEMIDKIFPEEELFTFKDLKNIAKSVLISSRNSCFTAIDLHQEVALKAAKLQVGPPPCLIFADTNWTNWYFAFIYNPGTKQLELWITDITGERGLPLSEWKRWFNKENRRPWGILIRPFEYTQTD